MACSIYAVDPLATGGTLAGTIHLSLFAPDHGLNQWYSAEGYAPYIVRLWNHAGTSVGNGVVRTPQRKECRTRLGA